MKPIYIDFDGVLHQFKEGWTGEIPEGLPIEDAIWAVTKLISKGYEVVVFTTRDNHTEVKKWLNNWGFPDMKITNTKGPALAYIDDRGIRFEKNWESIVKYFI